MLPRRVKLLAQTIEVKQYSQLMADPHGDGQMLNLDGAWENGDRVISMLKGMHPDAERVTFLHENLHAMCSFGNLIGDHDAEEGVVSRLAPIFLSWMRENPRAVSYLLEKA